MHTLFNFPGQTIKHRSTRYRDVAYVSGTRDTGVIGDVSDISDIVARVNIGDHGDIEDTGEIEHTGIMHPMYTLTLTPHTAQVGRRTCRMFEQL